jgi:putative membrane protein
MAQVKHLSAADREKVSAAVTAAETDTDGEIVTIVTETSDAYHDVALHYAMAAMLLVVALAAFSPAWLASRVAWFTGGWEAPDVAHLLLALLLIEAAVFLVVRYALAYRPLRFAFASKHTRARRVRRRAVQYFKVGAERRTQARVGVLLYLSLGERMAEIVADEAVATAVAPERWGDAMAALVAEVKHGRPGDGMAAAVAAIGAILAESFPKTDADINELPDRLIEL